MVAQPIPELAAFVETFIEVSGSNLPLIGLPSFQSLICINLADGWSSIGKKSGRHINIQGDYLFGHSDDMFLAKFPLNASFFFVKLKPGIASVFLKSNGCEIKDEQIDLTEIIDVNGLLEFHSQHDFNARVSTMQKLLRQLVNASSINHKLITIDRAFHLLQTRAFIDIDRLCNNLYVTYPTLRRYFVEQVGFSPKFCQKIIRFKKALQAYQIDGYTLNVHSFGYSNFSHFVKDAKALTGEAPRYFLSAESKMVQSNRSLSGE